MKRLLIFFLEHKIDSQHDAFSLNRLSLRISGLFLLLAVASSVCTMFPVMYQWFDALTYNLVSMWLVPPAFLVLSVFFTMLGHSATSWGAGRSAGRGQHPTKVRVTVEARTTLPPE